MLDKWSKLPNCTYITVLSNQLPQVSTLHRMDTIIFECRRHSAFLFFFSFQSTFIDLSLSSLIPIYWWAHSRYSSFLLIFLISSISFLFLEFSSRCLSYPFVLVCCPLFPLGHLAYLLVILNSQFNNSKISAISKLFWYLLYLFRL